MAEEQTLWHGGKRGSKNSHVVEHSPSGFVRVVRKDGGRGATPGGKVALTNHNKMGRNPSSKEFNIQRPGKSRHGRQGGRALPRSAVAGPGCAAVGVGSAADAASPWAALGLPGATAAPPGHAGEPPRCAAACLGRPGLCAFHGHRRGGEAPLPALPCRAPPGHTPGRAGPTRQGPPRGAQFRWSLAPAPC